MKINKETKIGIVLVLAIAGAVWGFNVLKGSNLFSRSRTFYAKYQNVSGLTVSSPVKVNGFKIGQVTDVRFLPGSTTGELLVQFKIDNKDFNFPKDSKARIVSSGLLGGNEIVIVPGKSSMYAEKGDTLRSELEAGLQQQVNEMIAPLKIKVENLIGSVDTVVTAFKAVFDDEGMGNISSGLTSLRKSIQGIELIISQVNTLLSNERPKISHIFTNVDSISGTIQKSNKDITNIIKNFSAVSDSLKNARISSTVNSLNRVMGEVDTMLTRVNRGEGTIGELLTNKALYNKLDSVVIKLNVLVQDITDHPDDYITVNLIKVGTSRERKERQEEKERKKQEKLNRKSP
ncbi:MAG: MlaD family protein [Flavobacteriales bacterium]|nr:MlaD family protein [Flavobacteriales bacterium]